jgi:hypothetical protein
MRVLPLAMLIMALSSSVLADDAYTVAEVYKTTVGNLNPKVLPPLVVGERLVVVADTKVKIFALVSGKPLGEVELGKSARPFKAFPLGKEALLVEGSDGRFVVNLSTRRLWSASKVSGHTLRGESVYVVHDLYKLSRCDADARSPWTVDARKLKKTILKRELKPGTRLPPGRDLLIRFSSGPCVSEKFVAVGVGYRVAAYTLAGKFKKLIPAASFGLASTEFPQQSGSELLLLGSVPKKHGKVAANALDLATLKHSKRPAALQEIPRMRREKPKKGKSKKGKPQGVLAYWGLPISLKDRGCVLVRDGNKLRLLPAPRGGRVRSIGPAGGVLVISGKSPEPRSPDLYTGIDISTGETRWELPQRGYLRKFLRREGVLHAGGQFFSRAKDLARLDLLQGKISVVATPWAEGEARIFAGPRPGLALVATAGKLWGVALEQGRAVRRWMLEDKRNLPDHGHWAEGRVILSYRGVTKEPAPVVVLSVTPK